MRIKTLWSSLIFVLMSVSTFAQKSDILKVMSNQKTAWNRGDIEGYMQGYWKNDSLVFIGSRGTTYGWKNTLNNYKKGYPNKERMGELDFTDIRIKMLGKKHALVIGKWKLIREKDSPSGIFTLIFERFHKDWRIISDYTE